MKLFALYSKAHLIEKPAWHDAFCKKYNPSSTGYHVTLKQPCYLKEEDAPKVKALLTDPFNSTPVPSHEIVLNFNDLVLDEGAGERKTIMINTEHQPSIHKLQKDILEARANFSRNFCKQ